LSIFITFEGIEGCGKTTQINHLTSFFKKNKRLYLLTREPGGTKVGEKIRQILLSSDNAGMEPMTELFLYVVFAVSRNLEGAAAGAEIWTHAFPIDVRRVDIVVDFFVPGVAAEQRSRVGKAYAGLYARLYDEDVAMMVARQRQLDRRIDGTTHAEHEIDLGPLAALELPRGVVVGGRDFILRGGRGSG